MLQDLIIKKLKEFIKLQDIIKTDELYHKSKRREIYNFSEYSVSIVFLRNIHEGYLSLEDADNFATELNN